MTESEKIGLFIKKRRKMLGMTQTDLTEKVGYKVRASVNKIENGLGDIPPNKLQKFADILQCNISELIPNSNINKDVKTYTISVKNVTSPQLNNIFLNAALEHCQLNYKKELLTLESEILELQNEYDNKIRASYLMICSMLQQLDKQNNKDDINNFIVDLQSIDTTDIKQLNDLRQKYKLD